MFCYSCHIIVRTTGLPPAPTSRKKLVVMSIELQIVSPEIIMHSVRSTALSCDDDILSGRRVWGEMLFLPLLRCFSHWGWEIRFCCIFYKYLFTKSLNKHRDIKARIPHSQTSTCSSQLGCWAEVECTRPLAQLPHCDEHRAPTAEGSCNIIHMIGSGSWLVFEGLWVVIFSRPVLKNRHVITFSEVILLIQHVCLPRQNEVNSRVARYYPDRMRLIQRLSAIVQTEWG